MPFTFECGVCHATYRLDEHQITATGVKITCPRCLNYFFLKRGGVQETPTPVVEYLVPDGAYDVSKKPLEPTPPPPPPALPKPNPMRETDLVEKFDQILPTKAGLTVKSDTKVTKVDLIELPPDNPKPTKFDRFFWPISLVGIVVLIALILNIRGIIRIPGFSEPAPQTEIMPPKAEVPSNPSNSKHGFPQVDSGYDPWTGKPIEPSPTPSKP